jgi:KaiC/GvpD/RAD55 family RecA-like ATPase
MPTTPKVQSGGGGWHYFFRHPGGIVKNSAEKIAPGLDIRGDGGYVVAAPSLHASGREYAWLIDATAPLADMPSWLKNQLKKASSKDVDKTKVAAIPDTINEGRRNDTLTALAGKLRRAGLSPNGIFHALRVENKKRCRPPLPEEEIKVIAKSIGSRPSGDLPAEIVTVNLADVVPKPIMWTWSHRIPRGGLTVLVGNPGEGKSTLTMDMASRVSTGTPWPDCPKETRNPGDVVILTAEDNLADVVVPRLQAAGADLRRIIAVECVKEWTKDGDLTTNIPFDIEQHTDALQAEIAKQKNTELIVIDPVTSFTGKTDSHKNAETRRVLARLSKLAEKNDVAIVAVTHFNKTASQSASQRIIGSVAFYAAARAVWYVARCPNDSARRLFLPGKNNLDREPDGMAFRLRGTQDGDITSVKVEFETEAIYMTIDEALNPKRDGEGNAITKVDDAATWLKEKLSEGERLSSTLIDDAKIDGFSRDILFKAKNRIGVRAVKAGFGADGQWLWRLPND